MELLVKDLFLNIGEEQAMNLLDSVSFITCGSNNSVIIFNFSLINNIILFSNKDIDFKIASFESRNLIGMLNISVINSFFFLSSNRFSFLCLKSDNYLRLRSFKIIYFTLEATHHPIGNDNVKGFIELSDNNAIYLSKITLMNFDSKMNITFLQIYNNNSLYFANASIMSYLSNSSYHAIMRGYSMNYINITDAIFKQIRTLFPGDIFLGEDNSLYILSFEHGFEPSKFFGSRLEFSCRNLVNIQNLTIILDRVPTKNKGFYLSSLKENRMNLSGFNVQNLDNDIFFLGYNDFLSLEYSQFSSVETVFNIENGPDVIIMKNIDFSLVDIVFVGETLSNLIIFDVGLSDIGFYIMGITNLKFFLDRFVVKYLLESLNYRGFNLQNRFVSLENANGIMQNCEFNRIISTRHPTLFQILASSTFIICNCSFYYMSSVTALVPGTVLYFENINSLELIKCSFESKYSSNLFVKLSGIGVYTIFNCQFKNIVDGYANIIYAIVHSLRLLQCNFNSVKSSLINFNSNYYGSASIYAKNQIIIHNCYFFNNYKGVTIGQGSAFISNSSFLKTDIQHLGFAKNVIAFINNCKFTEAISSSLSVSDDFFKLIYIKLGCIIHLNNSFLGDSESDSGAAINMVSNNLLNITLCTFTFLQSALLGALTSSQSNVLFIKSTIFNENTIIIGFGADLASCLNDAIFISNTTFKSYNSTVGGNIFLNNVNYFNMSFSSVIVTCLNEATTILWIDNSNQLVYFKNITFFIAYALGDLAVVQVNNYNTLIFESCELQIKGINPVNPFSSQESFLLVNNIFNNIALKSIKYQNANLYRKKELIIFFDEINNLTISGIELLVTPLANIVATRNCNYCKFIFEGINFFKVPFSLDESLLLDNIVVFVGDESIFKLIACDFSSLDKYDSLFVLQGNIDTDITLCSFKKITSVANFFNIRSTNQITSIKVVDSTFSNNDLRSFYFNIANASIAFVNVRTKVISAVNFQYFFGINITLKIEKSLFSLDVSQSKLGASKAFYPFILLNYGNFSLHNSILLVRRNEEKLNPLISITEGDCNISDSMIFANGQIPSVYGLINIRNVQKANSHFLVKNSSFFNSNSFLGGVFFVENSMQLLIQLNNNNFFFSKAISGDLMLNNSFGKGGVLYLNCSYLNSSSKVESNYLYKSTARFGRFIYLVNFNKNLELSSNRLRDKKGIVAPLISGDADNIVVSKFIPSDIELQIFSNKIFLDNIVSKRKASLCYAYVIYLDHFGNLACPSINKNLITFSNRTAGVEMQFTLIEDFYCLVNITNLDYYFLKKSAQITIPKLFFNPQHKDFSNISFRIEMRACIEGESYNINERTCIECLLGYRTTLISDSKSLFEPQFVCDRCLDSDPFYCYGTEKLSAKPGFARFSIESFQFLPCPNRDSCSGDSYFPDPDFQKAELWTSEVGVGLCKKGYTGILCSLCEENFGKTKMFYCESCLDKFFYFGITFKIVFKILILYMSIGTALSFNSKLDKNNKIQTYIPKMNFYLKILLSHFQVLMMMSSLSFSFQEKVKSIIQTIISASAPDLGNSLSLECFYNEAGIQINYQYAKAVLVLFFNLITNLFFFLYQNLSKRTKSKGYKYFKGSANLISLFMLINMITMVDQLKPIMELWPCIEIGDPSRGINSFRLIAQLNIDCLTDEHRFWSLIIALPLLFFMGIFNPIWLLVRLYKANKAKSLYSNAIISKYGYLYYGYNNNRFFYEFIVIFRKMSLLFVQTFYFSYPGGSKYFTNSNACLFLMMILLIFFFLQKYLRPYNSTYFSSVEKIDSISFLVLIITVYVGLFWSTRGSDISLPEGICLLVMLMLSNFSFVILWAMSFWKCIKIEISTTLKLIGVWISQTNKTSFKVKKLPIYPNKRKPDFQLNTFFDNEKQAELGTQKKKITGTATWLWAFQILKKGNIFRKKYTNTKPRPKPKPKKVGDENEMIKLDSEYSQDNLKVLISLQRKELKELYRRLELLEKEVKHLNEKTEKKKLKHFDEIQPSKEEKISQKECLKVVSETLTDTKPSELVKKKEEARLKVISEEIIYIERNYVFNITVENHSKKAIVSVGIDAGVEDVNKNNYTVMIEKGARKNNKNFSFYIKPSSQLNQVEYSISLKIRDSEGKTLGSNFSFSMIDKCIEFKLFPKWEKLYWEESIKNSCRNMVTKKLTDISAVKSLLKSCGLLKCYSEKGNNFEDIGGIELLFKHDHNEKSFIVIDKLSHLHQMKFLYDDKQNPINKYWVQAIATFDSGDRSM